MLNFCLFVCCCVVVVFCLFVCLFVVVFWGGGGEEEKKREKRKEREMIIKRETDRQTNRDIERVHKKTSIPQTVNYCLHSQGL